MGKKLLFAPVPGEPLGVALDDEAVVFAVNKSGEATASARGVVARLGLEGGYRWVRPLGEAVRSLPIVFDASYGAAVAVLVQKRDTLFLELLDLVGGAQRVETNLAQCSSTDTARVYAGNFDGDPGTDLLVWCRSKGGPLLTLLHGDGKVAKTARSPFIWLPQVVWPNDAGGSTRPAPRLLGEGASGILGIGFDLKTIDFPSTEDLTGFDTPIVDQPDAPPCLLVTSDQRLGCWTGPLGTPKGLAAAEDAGFEFPGEGGRVAFAFTVEKAPQGETRIALVGERNHLLRVTLQPELAVARQPLPDRIATASLGDTDEDGRWDLLVAVADELVKYDTDLRGPAHSRFPLGDLKATGVVADWFDTPATSARRRGRLDHVLFENAAPVSNTFARPEKTEPPLVLPAGATDAAMRFVLRAELAEPEPVESNRRTCEIHARNRRILAPRAFGSRALALDAGRLVTLNGAQVLTQLAPVGSSEIVRSFDTAASTVAYVTDTGAKHCSLQEPDRLDCQTLVLDPRLSGPIALATDGVKAWVARSDGSVGGYAAPAQGVPALDAGGLPADGSPVRLLRAFPGLLAVGRAQSLELYATGERLRFIDSHAIRADELVRCGDSRWYALSAGKVARADTAFDFQFLAEQPNFVRAIACDDAGGLLGIAPRYGPFALAGPPTLPHRQFWLLGALVAASGAGYSAYSLLKRRQMSSLGSTAKKGKGSSSNELGVERFFDVDAPKVDVASATRSQEILVDALRDFLDNVSTRPPLTIGIYGEWGSGKSSVMRMLSGELQETGRFVTVWFNAWRHQQEEQLGPALLHAIVREFGRQAGPRVARRRSGARSWSRAGSATG